MLSKWHCQAGSHIFVAVIAAAKAKDRLPGNCARVRACARMAHTVLMRRIYNFTLISNEAILTRIAELLNSVTEERVSERERRGVGGGWMEISQSERVPPAMCDSE